MLLLMLMVAVGLGAYLYRTDAHRGAASPIATSTPAAPANPRGTPTRESSARITEPQATTAQQPTTTQQPTTAQEATTSQEVTPTQPATTAQPTERVTALPPATPKPRLTTRSTAPATAGARPRARAAADARADAPVTSDTTAAAETPRAGADIKDAKNVSGSWRLATRIESSSYARYQGLQLGYDVRLRQEGDRIIGEGRKVSENDGTIARRGQTPISLTGTIDGDRLTLTFNERGAKRATQGKFVLMVDEGGTLRGRFSSTAARSSGTVEAHRLSQ
jgi:hypothetical protein